MKNMKNNSRPTTAGIWFYKAADQPEIRVEVTETLAAGRLCKELKMGGSSQCPGYVPWSGFWRQ